MPLDRRPATTDVGRCTALGPNDRWSVGRPCRSGDKASGASARRASRRSRHNLGDELGVVLDEFDGVSAAAGAQTTLGQGLLAEAVDRRDRRLVEAGQGPAQPGTAPLANPWRPGVEHDEPLVAGRQRGAVEVLGGHLQLGPDAVAQFGGCGSGVRDDEDLVDADAFGEIVVGRGRRRRTG